MLSFRTIVPHTLELLKYLMAEPYLENCRLAGGTALALQYGHRSSVDLDLFGDIPDDDLSLLEILSRFGKVQGQKTSKMTKAFVVDGIKVDFVNYNIQKYPDNSMFRVRMSLDYYDDAENQDNPKMFEKMDWIAVKETISKEVKNFDWRKYIDK